MKRRAFELAEHLRYMPRGQEELEAAKMLEQMAEVCELTRELVMAKTHDHSMAVFKQLEDMFKGKKDR